MSEKAAVARPALSRPRLPRLAAIALLAAVAAAAAATIALTIGGGVAAHTRTPARTHAAARVPPPRRHGARRRTAALVAEAPDPLAAQSYPEPAAAAARHARAAAPRVAATHAAPLPASATPSAGAPSLSTVEQQLNQERQIEQQLHSHTTATLVSSVTGAFAPRNVLPQKIAEVIAGGNAIADFPYVYGGGHGSFQDRAYDCSGSVSYALAAAGLIGAPETSGQLESWGAPGPGHWLTVFANAGHTFMVVDGVWFDTAGRAGPYSTRWLIPRPSLAGYAVRHYPGL
jgi:cell wall-associated NlpC family hydrolase